MTKREVLFLVWGGVWLAMEIGAHWVPAWAWPVLFVAFLIPELMGAANPASRDTLSETVWDFIGAPDHWARGILSVGIAGALALRFFSMPFLLSGRGPSWATWELWTPMAALALGLFGWLSVHFPARGRHG